MSRSLGGLFTMDLIIGAKVHSHGPLSTSIRVIRGRMNKLFSNSALFVKR